jgi:hypothetical protein
MGGCREVFCDILAKNGPVCFCRMMRESIAFWQSFDKNVSRIQQSAFQLLAGFRR